VKAKEEDSDGRRIISTPSRRVEDVIVIIVVVTITIMLEVPYHYQLE